MLHASSEFLFLLNLSEAILREALKGATGLSVAADLCDLGVRSSWSGIARGMLVAALVFFVRIKRFVSFSNLSSASCTACS